MSARRYRVPPADQSADTLEHEILDQWTKEDILAQTLAARAGYRRGGHAHR